MTIFNYTLIIISSLMLSGCFSSPTDKNGEDQIDLYVLWEYAYDFDGGAPRARLHIYNNTIITSGDTKITALNYKTGEQVWKTPFDFTRQLLNSSFGASSNVVTGSIVDQILAWDIKTGEFLWNVSFSDSLNFSQLSGITGTSDFFIAVGTGDNRLYKISISGDLEIVELDVRSYETTVSDGVLYANQRDGYPGVGVFSAMNAETMELLWRFEPGEFGFGTRVSPIVENGIVYVGTTGGPSGSKNGFFALDAQTGEELWRREGIFTYSAVLAGDRIFGVNGQRVWALNKETGELLWITRGQGGHSESNLDYLDGYVYWAHGSGLHVFDGESGELLHVMPAPDGSYFWRVTAGAGRIFAQSNRKLYAFAPWGHEEPLSD